MWTLESEEQPNLKLVVSNDLMDEKYVWLTIQPREQEASVCVDIEQLKHALRKLTAK